MIPTLKHALWVSLLALAISAPPAFAGELALSVGPPEIGTGGSNPISVPPVQPLEYQVVYDSDKDYETTVSLTPGCFFGKRSKLPNNVYVGLGGGVVFDGNGVGPGIYSSIGYSSGGFLRFNAEFKQAVGYDFSHKTVIAPYDMRIGIAIKI